MGLSGDLGDRVDYLGPRGRGQLVANPFQGQQTGVGHGLGGGDTVGQRKDRILAAVDHEGRDAEPRQGGTPVALARDRPDVVGARVVVASAVDLALGHRPLVVLVERSRLPASARKSATDRSMRSSRVFEGAPVIREVSAITASVGPGKSLSSPPGAPSDPLGEDMIEVRLRTLSGRSIARICPIIPPIERPTM